MVAAGADPAWPSRTLPAMVDAGLTDVESRDLLPVLCGRLGRLPAGRRHLVRLREQLLTQGLTPQDLDRIRELMASPQTYIRLPPFWSTVGYRP